MIPVFKPHIGSETIKAATDALDLGWLGMGAYVKEFEEALTEYLELPAERRLVAVNTCTSALHLALLLAGVGPGDEVITPALNNIGDFQAIGMCGARPVFVDIGDYDLGINPALIEPLITPKVKAIIALHYSGIPCRIGEVLEIAQQHGLRVIEDAAHAIGTRRNGRKIGSDGDLTCFSFDAIKNLTCIDGGAVVTPNAVQAERLYPARLLGMTQSNERLYSNARAYHFDVVGPGFRYHLANLHASIGLSQLKKLPEFTKNRQAYCRLYNQLLQDVSEIIIPKSDFEDVGAFIYVIRVLDDRRRALANYLKERGVETGIHWLPGNRFTWFKGCRGADSIRVTDRIGDEILTLPLWSYMTEEVILEVANAIRSFFRRASVVLNQTPLYGAELAASVKTRPSSLATRYTIPIQGVENIHLRVVSASSPAEEDVTRLTEWRNRYVRAFLTEFEATPDRTREWLKKSVVNDASRILFMIEEEGKLPLGYIGLAFIDYSKRTAEMDSVVRGEPGYPGIMRRASMTLMRWATENLGIKTFGVRVLADNPAVKFYEKLGFRERRRVPLERVCQEGLVIWKEADGSRSSDRRWLIHMELDNPRGVEHIDQHLPRQEE